MCRRRRQIHPCHGQFQPPRALAKGEGEGERCAGVRFGLPMRCLSSRERESHVSPPLDPPMPGSVSASSCITVTGSAGAKARSDLPVHQWSSLETERT